MIKKLLITTFIGTLAYFLIGWFVFDFILGNYTDQHTARLVGFKKTSQESSLILLIVSCGAYAALMSFMLVYLLNLKQLMKAFTIGAIVGVLVAIMADSYWLAVTNFYSNSTVVIFDIIGAGFTVGLLGLIVALTNKNLG